MLPFFVASYVNPDLDGFACILAYANFLNQTNKKAIPGVIGSISTEAQFLVDRFSIEYATNDYSPREFEKIVLVDASQLTGIDARIDPEKVVEIIDHRKFNDAEKFPNAKKQIELVGAAATLITEKFMSKEIILPREIAVLLYGAIISNTLNFQAKVTTERDRLAARWLNGALKLPDNFAEELFLSKSDLSGMKLAQAIRDDFATFKLNNIGIAQLELIGARELAEIRSEEIFAELEKINREKKLNLIFASLIDLKEGCNIFLSNDNKIQKLLEKLFKVTFNSSIAIYPSMIMRKEIIPLLQEELANNDTKRSA